MTETFKDKIDKNKKKTELKDMTPKEIIDGVEAFVFSNNPDYELFSVRFSLVGANQGNYIITSTNAIANIFEYVSPVAGVPQGNYEPIIQLIAPTKLQMAVVNGSYKPTEKTTINFEIAVIYFQVLMIITMMAMLEN